jgi:hypothetical protein
MRWDSTPFKNSKNMKTLGGLFNNHANMTIPLKIIQEPYDGKQFPGGVLSN